MNNKIRNFLYGSLIVVFVICIAVFLTLSTYLNHQNDTTVAELGNIYMSSMNDRISKHFGSITDNRISQLKSIMDNIPPDYRDSKEKLDEWINYYGKSRGYEAFGYWRDDGKVDMIYGGQIEIRSLSPLQHARRTGKGRVAIGYNGKGEQVVLFCAPVKFDVPGAEHYVGLVGELPISYIDDALSLEDENSLIYSFVIREDGSFVVDSSDVTRKNYFDRVDAVYEDTDGMSVEQYKTELKKAMTAGEDYSGLMIINGERRHLYCSALPNSIWYLITFMPYGALNKSVETMEARSFVAAACACTVILAAVLVAFTFYIRMNRAQMKELEEAKLAADEANKAKSEFLSNMSHDIRTPMNAIVGMTAIASSHVNDPQQVSSCLAKITRSGKHLLGLINDVLDMSKIESGKMTLNVEPISLRDSIDNIVSIVLPQIKAKEQKFNVSIDNIISENVYCDGVRLSRVFLNILSNAMKFTPEKGAIDVELSEEQSPKGDEYVHIRIKIRDTGIGMSEEFRRHIFESFAREDNKRIQKIEGTGLGMAITKYIVDAMEGEISVASEQGKGTEFKVELDLKRADEPGDELRLTEHTLLIVNSDRQLCENAAGSLRSLGITAEWALDGKAALERAAEGNFDIILLDRSLSDMDGIQAVKELRGKLGDDTPTLLMSAYDCTDIEDEARAAGIAGSLSKPLFRSTLYDGLLPFTDGGKTQSGGEEAFSETFNKRILLAEDNDLNWEVAQNLLSALGLELEWAENGQIAVEMFQRSEVGYYDAVLMDIRMPVMDGYGAADAIRAMDRRDAGLPIIAMTADAYSDDIQKCLAHGMNAHVAKPIDVNEIIRVLKKFL